MVQDTIVFPQTASLWKTKLLWNKDDESESRTVRKTNINTSHIITSSISSSSNKKYHRLSN